MRGWSILVLLAVAGTGKADDRSARRISLVLPVRCALEQSCWVQKYADLAAGPELRDYRCGMLTTDSHDGTDFRLASLSQMESGVQVVAAEAGTVLRVRNSEPDLGAGPASFALGREAGNGLVIDHGDGWETQYSHLKRGSVSVRPGDRVAAGEPIGLIGLSGDTEYPHLHFSVRYNGLKIDPFTGLMFPAQCGSSTNASLWKPATLSAMPYLTPQVVRVAITNEPQTRATLRVSDPHPPGRQDAMLVMVEMIGAEAGTIVEFDLLSPDARQIVAKQMTIERPNLSWIGYAGKNAPVAGWQPGKYTASVAVSGVHIPRRRIAITFDLK
jgi:hypothetical protein